MMTSKAADDRGFNTVLTFDHHAAPSRLLSVSLAVRFGEMVTPRWLLLFICPESLSSAISVVASEGRLTASAQGLRHVAITNQATLPAFAMLPTRRR